MDWSKATFWLVAIFFAMWMGGGDWHVLVGLPLAYAFVGLAYWLGKD